MASPSPDLRCLFCEQGLGAERPGINGNIGSICWECVEFCLNLQKWKDPAAFEAMMQRATDFEPPPGMAFPGSELG
jgi:hypothetical protein